MQQNSYGEKEDEKPEAIRRGRSSVVYEMFSSGGIELGIAVSAVIVNYIFELQLIFVKICGLKNKKLTTVANRFKVVVVFLFLKCFF